MNLLLTWHQAPGDTVASTAAVASLLAQVPEARVYVSGTASKEVFWHYPRTRPHAGEEVDYTIKMDNSLINSAPLHHFLDSYCHTLSTALGFQVERRYDRPIIYISPEEKKWMGRVQEVLGERRPYWVVCSGVKSDFTVKRYPHDFYQQVVDVTSAEDGLTWVQVGQAKHDHRPLQGVVDQVGRTDLRELIRLLAHDDCRGCLSPESLCHHLAAAFQKPCVTLASGFLTPGWFSYTTGRVLTRMGCLPCCRTGCCGASRVVPLGDGDAKDTKLCSLPVVVGQDTVGRCLADISPDEVVSAIRAYIRGGV
jgi:ADP-heptose:LPS heptosyltransferase